eukprot:Skav201785  [mRNA]  locus=scaffold2375:63668:64055:+ [translate_table: standard]
MKLREPATHPATTLMPLTQFVEAAAINLAPLKVMVRMLLITSSWSSLAAKLEEFARSRRSAASKVLTPP